MVGHRTSAAWKTDWTILRAWSMLRLITQSWIFYYETSDHTNFLPGFLSRSCRKKSFWSQEHLWIRWDKTSESAAQLLWIDEAFWINLLQIVPGGNKRKLKFYDTFMEYTIKSLHLSRKNARLSFILDPQSILSCDPFLEEWKKLLGDAHLAFGLVWCWAPEKKLMFVGRSARLQ